MRPALRKLSLTAHITSSIGWLGAVASFLALSVTGLTSRDPEVVRAAYVAMNVVGAVVIVPLSVAALVTGVLESFVSHWGLLRYYWVVAKLALTIAAVSLLLMHQFTAVEAAAKRVSALPTGTAPAMGRLGVQLAADAAGAVVVLLIVTTLGVYKPWGMTGYALRKEERQRSQVTVSPTDPGVLGQGMPRGLRIFLAVVAAILVVIVVVHLAGGGLGHYGQ